MVYCGAVYDQSLALDVRDQLFGRFDEDLIDVAA